MIARGNERKSVFRDDRDRESYLERLAACRGRLGFFVYAYCLMDNHVHLALERGPEPLSRIMLTLQSAYTQRFNKRHDRVGHLFQGRYKAFLVDRDQYLFALVRYIHRNPVEAGIVSNPEDYRWSSDRFYRRDPVPEWMDADRVLQLLGRRKSTARLSYHRLMDRSTDPKYDEAAVLGGAIVGDEEYADRVLRVAMTSLDHDRTASIEWVAQVVALREQLAVADLRRAGNAAVPSAARSIAAYLGRREFRIPVSRTARYFGRDESTLLRGALRLENEQRRNPSLRRRIDALARELRTGATKNTRLTPAPKIHG